MGKKKKKNDVLDGWLEAGLSIAILCGTFLAGFLAGHSERKVHLHIQGDSYEATRTYRETTDPQAPNEACVPIENGLKACYGLSPVGEYTLCSCFVSRQ